MNKNWLLVAACLSFALPAFAKSLGEKTGVNSALGVTPSTHDFVQEVALSDMFEIRSSRMALQKADAATKSFAQRMITDHGKTSAELKAMVQSGAVQQTPPTDLDSAHQGKLDKLASLDGNDFTKQYRADQVDAHKDAVALFERYAKGGDNAQLKEWADKTLPTLQQHLQMAQDLNK